MVGVAPHDLLEEEQKSSGNNSSKKAKEEQAEKEEANKQLVAEDNENTDEAHADEINAAFDRIVAPKKRKNLEDLNKNKKKKKKTQVKDTEKYIPYQSADKNTEDGIAMDSFERRAMNAEFSVLDRDNAHEVFHQSGRPKPNFLKLDRIEKRKYF